MCILADKSTLYGVILYMSEKLTPQFTMLTPPEGFPEGPPRRAIVFKEPRANN
jgi:hypothetical protein